MQKIHQKTIREKFCIKTSIIASNIVWKHLTEKKVNDNKLCISDKTLVKEVENKKY